MPEKLCKNCGQPLLPRQRRSYEWGGYGDVMPRKWCTPECGEEWYANHGYWVAATRVVWRRASGGSGREDDAACEKCEVKRVKTIIEQEDRYPRQRVVWNTTFEVHHIIALDGGKRNENPLNIPSNLVLVCFECHRRAHNWRRHAADVGYLKEPVSLNQCEAAEQQENDKQWRLFLDEAPEAFKALVE